MKHNGSEVAGRSRRSRFWVGGVVVAMFAFLLAPVAPANAASSDGWVRLAHMSPDTGAVRGSLSTTAGKNLLTFNSLGYGAVSRYAKLPAGNYTLQMQPSVGGFDAPVLVSKTITVSSGEAKTVLAYGKNANLKLKVVEDSLQSGGAGKARARVLQVAAGKDDVSATVGDTSFLSGAGLGTVGSYKNVSAGDTSFALKSGSDSTDKSVSLKAGSVYSIFVVTDSKDDLTLVKTADSAASSIVPKGALGAGGGYLAEQAQQRNLQVGGISLAALALLGTGAVVLRRRRVES